MPAANPTFPPAALETLTHERVQIIRGARSGVSIVIAVHSTDLGQATGGVRVAHYPDWAAAVSDALRLSAAMTDKCALAGLPHGGGKTVVMLGERVAPTGSGRTEMLHDIGDAIQSLDGAYAAGPDVGTGPTDMSVVGERTAYVCCRRVAEGGSGDSSVHTARGTLAALRTVADKALGSPDPAGRSFAILGLGGVGARVARLLHEEGADLVLTDIDPGKQALARELGATWVPPDEAGSAEVDVLVPAALGGMLTPSTVPLLRCAAVAGPANNQLDRPETADLLAERDILWAPDEVVSAGGVVYATSVDLRHEPEAWAAAQVDIIGDTLRRVLQTAQEAGITPYAAVRALAAERISRPGGA